MYRPADLMDCLFGLIGWHQNQNPDYPTLPDELTATASGLYFQDEHPIMSIENIDQALKNYDRFNYPGYAEHGVYAINARVRYALDGRVYAALAVIADAPAILNPADWEEVNLFAQKLEALTRASINKVATEVFTKKKLDGITKSIFENVQLFDGVGDMTNKEPKSGRFVGFQVVLEDHRDITAIIRRIGTQFSIANPDFKLYIFHSSQVEPISIIPLALSRANSFEWSAKELIMRFNDPTLDTGGAFYIGYYEVDLVGQAINRGYDFGNAPTCSTCNRNYAFYNQWSKYMDVTPFSVPATFLVGKLPSDIDGAQLWDLNANQYVYLKSWGLNLDISVRCDVTDFLCRERDLFMDALLKQVALDVAQELFNSTRNNPNAKETRDLAGYAIEDEKDGLRVKQKRSLEALNFDISDLNEACIPCNNKAGVTWGSVG